MNARHHNGLSTLRLLRTVMLTTGLFISTLHVGSAFAQETYKVGVTNSGMPFSSMNIKTNQMEGFMVDLMQALSKEQGFKLTEVNMEFGALIPALTTHKIDLSAAPMYSTEARQKVVSFSTPLYSYGEGLLVKSDDNTAYTSLAELKGQKVGAVSGTIFIDSMTKMGIFSEVKGYATESDLMRDVSLGRIKGGIVDAPMLAYQLSKESKPNLKLVPTYKPEMSGSIAIAAPKDKPELIASIDQGIAKLRADNRFASLLKKWSLTE